MERKCRWGFLSTADIGRKNWQAIFHADNAVVTAVASRSEDKAQEFIKDCQSFHPFDPAPRAMGSYEELLSSDEVDAVYVPLPTALRRPWVVKAAEAGKHVLCEKPCGVSKAEVAEMTRACEANGVQFMDGVMFMHSQRLPAMKQVLQNEEEFGKLRRIGIQFSFCGPDEFFTDNIRTHSDLEPAGCLGDLGWYCIRMILWGMDWELPHKVTATILTEAKQPSSPEAVPVEFSAELFFEDGVSASFYCSFITKNQQLVRFCGSKGYLELNDFVLPYLGSELNFDLVKNVFNVHGCDFNMERHATRHSVAEYANSWPSAQETQLIRTFSETVNSGQMDSQWPRYSVATQTVLDACFEAARSQTSVKPGLPS